MEEGSEGDWEVPTSSSRGPCRGAPFCREGRWPYRAPHHSDPLIPQQNRQMKHISAEQKRRFNIKMGFDTLNSLISNNSKLVSGIGWVGSRFIGLGAGWTARVAVAAAALTPPPLPQTSHAITLQKTVEYITKLQQERSQMQEEARRLREEIEELNTTIM